MSDKEDQQMKKISAQAQRSINDLIREAIRYLENK
ncbi:hypothetical protein [Brasilonema sp. UFV-L1]